MMQHKIDLPPGLTPADGATRRPRIGIMGEFSAGKSTLTNLLIGSEALPVRVTATQLPPVWLSHGDGEPYRVALDGTEFPVDLERIEDIPVADTLCLRLFARADVLEMCDLIDFPGISDPNMAPEVWERIAPLVDCVLWCTHATQAWRQSEAAVWGLMSSDLHAQSLLLLTRMDKIVNDRDRARVLRRVSAEVEGLFAQVLPVSLLRAAQARDDREAWEASGGEALMRALIDRLLVVSDRLGRPASAIPAGIAASTGPAPDCAVDEAFETPLVDPFARLSAAGEPSSESARPERNSPLLLVPSDTDHDRQAASPAAQGTPEQDAPARILPRRVTPVGGARARRPRLSAAAMRRPE